MLFSRLRMGGCFDRDPDGPGERPTTTDREGEGDLRRQRRRAGRPDGAAAAQRHTQETCKCK